MATPSSTTYDTSASGVDRDDGGEDTVEGGEEEGVISGVTHPPKRIVLTKRTYLLVAFVIVTVLSTAAIVYAFVFHLDEYDYPPTENSNQSLRDAIHALIALTVVTPIGFIILKFRITNMVMGVLYLFLLVLCLVFPAKSITEAAYSLTTDTEFNIHLFAKNPYNEGKLHNFWAAFQAKYSCCGTKDIDRVEDLSYFTNTSDLPASCCTENQRKYARSLGLLLTAGKSEGPGQSRKPELDITSSYCGRGLARSRNRGLGIGINRSTIFKRIFSGFFLSLTTKQVEKMYVKLNLPQFHWHPEQISVEIMDVVRKRIQEVDAVTAFKKIWKNFYVDSVCNTMDAWYEYQNSTPPTLPQSEKYCTYRHREFDNDIAYPANLNHTTSVLHIGILKNFSRMEELCRTKGYALYEHELRKIGHPVKMKEDEYCTSGRFPKSRQNVTTIGRELLLQLDYLTSYIYELGIYQAHYPPVGKGTWMLWNIPTRLDLKEMYPYKLNANLLRVADVNKSKEELKQMYYFSRGIAENLVLEKIVHEKTCESLDPKHIQAIRTKVARDLNKRWRQSRPYTEWKNQDEGLGLFFLYQVRKINYISISVSSAAIACVIVLAVVFSQYYSRIKAEEYANLALPKEFEVLHLKRGSLIDEADIVREYRPPQPRQRGRFWGRRVAPAPGLQPKGAQPYTQPYTLAPRKPFRWGGGNKPQPPAVTPVAQQRPPG